MLDEIDRFGVHDSVSTLFPPAVLAEELSDLPFEVTVTDDAALASCDGVVTLDHREAFHDLEWVHSIQAGVDRFPFDSFEAEGVVLTNSAGIHGRSVGETVTGFMLAFARRLHRHVEHATERRWVPPEWDEAFTLPDTSACVVGTGTLGRGVARVAGSLGVSMTGVRRSADPVPGFDDVYAIEDLHTAIADVDFVVSTLPLTDETHHVFASEEFAAMAGRAYFINVGRGPLVDEDALIEALRAGELAGAALDVFEIEPLPEESPLWEMDEVIVTPHSAAFTRDYYREIAGIVRENVRRMDDGEKLQNRVV